MGQQPVVLGIDVGTSGVKVVAVNPEGSVLAGAQRELHLVHAHPDRAEQELDDVLDALAVAARETVARLGETVAHLGETVRIEGLACSTSMHSLIALDAEGKALTRALSWADNRAADQAAELLALPEAGELTRRTGTPISAMSPLAKLRWFAEREPAVAERAAHWVSMKDHLLAWLTGEAVVDHSTASASGLFDIERRDWDPAALRLAHVRREQLSPLVPTTAQVGPLRREAAQRLGLAPGLPVVAGAADGCLENLGGGAVDEGQAAVTIGTSGAVRAVVNSAQGDPQGRLFCYVLTDDRWVIGGPISNGGLVLRWARDRLLPELAERAPAEPYALFDELASGVPAGASGLVCLPALVGERAPCWDPDRRGVLLGLDPSHGREHVLRALMEGVAYRLATVFELLETGRTFTAVHATGGFTSSDLWLRIVAGVLDRPLVVPRDDEGASFGAALLGLQVLGFGDAFDLARTIAQEHETALPDPADREVYRRTLDVFRTVGATLDPQFAALAELRAGH